MKREDTVKILSILKVAYPNFYKNISREEANAVVNLWTLQFKEVPYDVLAIAINKIIATNTFPPTISEIKAKLSNMATEAMVNLMDYRGDEKTKEKLRRIEECCRTINIETSLTQIIGSYRGDMLIDETHDKQSS